MSKTGAQGKPRGEVSELRDDLQSTTRAVHRQALRRVIASMTIGRDVSNLFNDVVALLDKGCSEDSKKLVYLYVIANAKVQQDKAVLLAGNFVKDAKCKSPLIRGLAIRTMSAVQVEKMADHFAGPLREALRDSDPYVRRCAATAVAKMFATNRQRMEDGGFLHHLQELLCDYNPTVIAAAICALNEIRSSSDVDREALDLGNRSGGLAVNDLLVTLGDSNACNEWGQIYILEGLATYQCDSQEQAELICSRVMSKLQHGNAAVVLATVRIIVNYIERWGKSGANDDTIKSYCAKIAPPLVSLVSGGSDVEIRYVALRNISLILNRYPDLLTAQTKVFFVKYNDPIYVKLEKLDILLQLVNHQNYRGILHEFNEYAQEVDVEFVRKSVRSIGVTAIKLEPAAEECAGVLSTLIKSRVNYVVQEVIIVVRDVFRKYPGRYEGLIGLLWDSLDTLDEPEAKASMIWIIGEYAEKIENAEDLLDDFLESFEDETPEVQLAILTATVKLFLKRPDETEELLQKVLKCASSSEDPDLRDRGYIYWRLLSIDPEAAWAAVIGDQSAKESINEEKGSKMDPKLLSQLIEHVGTLASVYHKPPSTFVQNYFGKMPYDDDDDEGHEVEDEVITHQPGQEIVLRGADAARGVWCPREATHGVEINGRFVEHQGTLCIDLNLANTTDQNVSGMFMQLDVNSFGITMAANLQVPEPFAPGAQHDQIIPLAVNPSAADGQGGKVIRVALKTSLGLGFGATTQSPVPLMFLPGTPLEKAEFLQVWKAIEKEVQFAVQGPSEAQMDERMRRGMFQFVAKRSDPAQDGTGAELHHYYYSANAIDGATPAGAVVTLEVAFSSLNPGTCMVSIRTANAQLVDLVKMHIMAMAQ